MKRFLASAFTSAFLVVPVRTAAAADPVAAIAPLAPEAVHATPAAPAPPGDQPTPRLKLSYVHFSAGNADGTAMPLQAIHLDMYALSWNWLRGGVSVEAGRGPTTFAGYTGTAKYGLLGVVGGVQLPGPLTPFLEGSLAGGVLAASLDGTVTIPGTSITMNGLSAATWMYARGLDAGVEIYTVGRAYLSLSIGWVRTTWGSADYQAMLANLSAGLSFKDITYDSFLLKIGLGI